MEMAHRNVEFGNSDLQSDAFSSHVVRHDCKRRDRTETIEVSSSSSRFLRTSVKEKRDSPVDPPPDQSKHFVGQKTTLSTRLLCEL